MDMVLLDEVMNNQSITDFRIRQTYSTPMFLCLILTLILEFCICFALTFDDSMTLKGGAGVCVKRGNCCPEPTDISATSIRLIYLPVLTKCSTCSLLRVLIENFNL